MSRFLRSGRDISADIVGNHVTFSDDYLQQLKSTVLESMNGDSRLAKQRQTHVEEFFSCISNNDLRKILQRVFIIERADEQSVQDEICKMLKCQYFIPESECEDALETLVNIVRTGRNSGENIVADLKGVIQKKSQNRIMPYDEKYCIRENFESLKAHFLEKNVLLLTGVPFSGKTYLAKAIAQEFQKEGYLIRRTENIIDNSGISHFMCAPDNDQRLLLLEDPFGYVEISDKASEVLGNVLKLIRENLASNRKLIITTRKDILYGVFRKQQLPQCGLLGHNWWDVSINSVDEAKSVWEECYGDSEESVRIFTDIYEVLRQDTAIFLEVGEIRHLYTEIPDITELKELSIEEIIARARISVEEVCRKIFSYDEEFQKLFILLGCFCNTIRTLSLDDLAYILSKTDENVSVRNADDWSVSVTIGGGVQEEKEEFPKYSQKTKLDEKSIEILRELCRIGYLYRDSITKEVVFAHPLYFHASKMLLARELEEGWYTEEFLTYLHLAIGSLSRNAAMCSLQSLQQSFECDEKVITAFFKGSNSIFPAVRDTAFKYLDWNFELLDESMQKEFMKNMVRAKVTERYMRWDGEECWYQKSNEYRERFEDIFGTESDLTVEDMNARLEAGEPFSKKEIYDVLYDRRMDEIPLRFLEYALLCDETVIRSKAIYYVFALYAGQLGEIQEKYLTQFENCNVVYSMLIGALENWKSYGEMDRQLLISYFKGQLHRSSVAFYMKDFFEQFGQEYDNDAVQWYKYDEDEKRELWEVWAVLMAEWLRCFPVRLVSMDQPHMSYTMDQSREYLKNHEVLMEVGRAWLQWLEKYSSYRSLDDYGMSALEYIVKGTEDVPELREGIVEQALNEKDSNIAASHVMNLILCWNMLTDTEKNSVCQFLSKKDRPDYRWMQAVAMVLKQVPQEVQTVICGNGTVLKGTAKDLMMILDSKGILEECLSMYCGFPQPLWYNGYHHNERSGCWDNVIIEVLKRGKMDRCYYIALREFIEALYNRASHRFKDGYALYQQLIQQPENREQIFERLGYCLIYNQKNKQMWDELISAGEPEEIETFFQKLSKYVAVVERKYFGGECLWSEFDMAVLMKYLLPQFPADNNMIRMSENIVMIHRKMEENPMEIDAELIDEMRKTYLGFVRKIYKETPPQLHLTDTIVKITASEIEIRSEELEELFVKSSESFKKRCEAVEKSFAEHCLLEIDDRYSLENWVEKSK